jgi:transposase
VIDAVGVMDLAAFYAAYRADGHGRAAYELSVMVALLLYCWARGVRSSRRAERGCVEDVACRVIVGQQRPDHATPAKSVGTITTRARNGERIGLCQSSRTRLAPVEK